MTYQALFEAALALSVEERARLRDELEASLAVEADAEFLMIIAERSARFRAGEVGIPAEEVFAEARRR